MKVNLIIISSGAWDYLVFIESISTFTITIILFVNVTIGYFVCVDNIVSFFAPVVIASVVVVVAVVVAFVFVTASVIVTVAVFVFII